MADDVKAFHVDTETNADVSWTDKSPPYHVTRSLCDDFTFWWRIHNHCDEFSVRLLHRVTSSLGAGILRNADCGKLSRGNLRKIKCGTFRKLPLLAFPHSAAEKFRISADRKTTVRSHCTTDVQPMHTIPWSLGKWKKWKMIYWI